MFVKREVTCEAIIVGRMSAGEGSVRVLFFTRELGLVTALAKSAREERSKLRAHLQLATRGTYTFVKGKDVWRVTGVTAPINGHFALSEDPSAQEALARVLGSLRQFVRGEDPHPDLYNLLTDYFSSLLSIPGEFVRAAESIAVLRLLWALGYVREDPTTSSYLSSDYSEELLERANHSRQEIVHAINEAITASGL